jgi:hypothetical protein
MVLNDTLKVTGQAVSSSGNQELKKEYEQTLRFLTDHKLISELTVDQILNAPIDRVVQPLDERQNDRSHGGYRKRAHGGGNRNRPGLTDEVD